MRRNSFELFVLLSFCTLGDSGVVFSFISLEQSANTSQKQRLNTTSAKHIRQQVWKIQVQTRMKTQVRTHGRNNICNTQV
jgi:hypothetical protein